ncbi:MAG: D-arabitol-phosphate dehydrogenase [Chlamydiales bacterium]|nr:D-arabitol-phosphate dehydrogenase [Chlamydiales bacterium]
MKAIILTPGTTDVHLADRPDPEIQYPDEVKLRVLEVGVCGTDRDETHAGRAEAPSGANELIIGHEMLGQVVEVGASVKNVKPGDYAVFTVRRGCGECPSCLMDFPDMCYSGNYTERGIKGHDGYQAEFVVDREKFIVKVPDCIKRFAVLCEPTSVVEKAIDEMTRIQRARLPDWANAVNLEGKRALVAGLGPIGLLAAIILTLRGAEVIGYDIVDPKSYRPSLLNKLGGTYIDGKSMTPAQIPEHFGRIDLVVEAAGVAKLDYSLLEALGTNGAYVLTGVPEDKQPFEVPGGALMKQMVLKNQVLIGSVNAAKRHWDQAVLDLEQAYQKWGDSIEMLITKRVHYDHFKDALDKHETNDIKNVVSWCDF